MANKIIDGNLELYLLLRGPSTEAYIHCADKIAQGIYGRLEVGGEYTLFIKHGVTSADMKKLKRLTWALHDSFGDNGKNYQVNLNAVGGRRDRIKVSIGRSS